MLVTMLLLPALANAWTFGVKVTNTTTGIASGNKATVTVGSTSTDVTANLHYFILPGSVTVAVANAPSAAISLVDGTLPEPVVAGTTNTYVIPANATKALKTLSVVYGTAATVENANLSVVQTPGGMTQLVVESSSSVKGFTGVPVGTAVTVKPNASTGYSLTGVTLNGKTLAAPYTFTVADAAADVVTAFYTKDAVVTATLALAQSGPVGTPVTATVTATGATGYAWTVNGVAQASTTSAMTFSPVAGANMVQVTIAGAAVPVVKSASFMGYNATQADNYTCISCHSGSTATIVNAYTASGHADDACSPTCAACHSSEPHNVGVNASNISASTFKVISTTPVTIVHNGVTTVITKANGLTFCAGCHNGTDDIPHVVTGLTVTCAGCHSSSSDAHGIKTGATIAQSNPTDCLTCHMARNAAIISAFTASAHNNASCALTCTSCHGNTTHASSISAANIDPVTYRVGASPVSVTSHNVTTTLTTGQVFCAGCHNGTHAIPHALTGLGNTCAGCHSSSGDAHGIKKANHDTAVASGTDAASCGTCHSNMQHWGGTAFLKAQYVSDASLPVSCSSCHGTAANTTANQAILRQFTSSSHGSPIAEAWRHYDWRSGSRISCQRCHAGTAFVARLGNENDITNVYEPTDILKPGEVLNCSACHTDAGTGALRTASEAFSINMTNAATVTYDVAGASTLCARCHSGRETGDSIKAHTDADGVLAYMFNSHYLPAAAILFNKGGYEYASQDYDILGSHKGIGSDQSGQGPCVTCHMGLGTANHTWKIANSNACDTCHSNPTAANLAVAKATHHAALDSLRLALEAKGIYYHSAHPNFFTAAYNRAIPNIPFTNWAGAYGVSSWKDVMGAAFNYNLLVNEPGAYAHNKQYALKLIADSCDFLADGAVDGIGIPAAVTTAFNSHALILLFP